MLWCVVILDGGRRVSRYGSSADCMDWLGVLQAQRIRVHYCGPVLGEDGTDWTKEGIPC